MNVTAFDLAQRFVGVKEVSGRAANPAILAMLQLDSGWPQDDAVPWCSAFINYIAWLLRLPRSKSLRARSWLTVGLPISLSQAQVGFDVVILNRGGPSDPSIIEAPGHAGWFAGINQVRQEVILLSGNQANSVTLHGFPMAEVLGVRRLA